MMVVFWYVEYLTFSTPSPQSKFVVLRSFHHAIIRGQGRFMANRFWFCGRKSTKRNER
jgi:hypothetical protein